MSLDFLNQKVMGSLAFAFRLEVLWRESSRKGTWIIELWFHTVDGRIPKQPPGMYDKKPINNKRNYQPQLVNARFQPWTETMFWSNFIATYFCRVGNYPKNGGFLFGKCVSNIFPRISVSISKENSAKAAKSWRNSYMRSYVAQRIHVGNIYLHLP